MANYCLQNKLPWLQVVSGLIASGLPTSTFTFIGFLPPKPGLRRNELVRLQRTVKVPLLPFILMMWIQVFKHRHLKSSLHECTDADWMQHGQQSHCSAVHT